MAKKDIDTSTEDILRVRNAAQSEFEDALVAQFNDMQSAVGALNSTWEGPNHDSFVIEFANHCEGIEDFHLALGVFLKAWNTAARLYLNCESDVAGYVN